MDYRASLYCSLAALLLTPAFAQQPGSATDSLPATVPSGRPVVGLALEGGGALGLAHIGVLRWIDEHHIPIDRIAGTSMGSLVGGLYATGTSPEDLETLARSNSFQTVFTLQSRYTDVSFRRRQDRQELPYAFAAGLAHGPELRNSLLHERGVNEFLSTVFFAYNRQELDYNQTPIPFRCVATDLTTLQPVTFDHGPLPQSVRASISIPGVFPPVLATNGDYLVDGGILDNLPTDILRRDLHASLVIAVHLQDAPLSAGDTSSIVGVLNRAFSAGIVQNVQASLRLADITIEVPLGHYSSMDYGKAHEMIRLGYEAAEASRERLLPLALDDAHWKAYLAERASRRQHDPGRLSAVQIAGGSPGAAHQVEQDLLPLRNQPIAPGPILHALTPVQSNNDLSANYSFFTPKDSSANDAALLVRLKKDPIGPPYLLIAPEFSATTSNPIRSSFQLRLVDQNFTGYGSELRATAQVGYLTALSVEYYRLLGGFFLQPSLQTVRKPVYIWRSQKRVAERFQQNLDAGMQFGRTFSNHFQVAAEWKAIDTRWALRTGSDGEGYLRGAAQTGLLWLHLDEASSGTISPNGFRMDLAAGAFYNAYHSDNAPFFHLNAMRTHSWHGNNIFGLSTEIDSYLRANVAQPWRFTLGGPMRLSASSFDEFRGTDTLLTRAGWLRRIAPIPLEPGQGLYVLLGYESGEVWSPESRAMLRQDVNLGVVGNTPIGVFSLGTSIGDAGHRKVFLTLGRFF